MFLAMYRAMYAAERSTLVGSLPEKAPPPCGAYPPYVSTIIFLPVSPASPCGPPTTKRPVGFMWNFVVLSSSSTGTVERMTCSSISLRSCSFETSGECCVEMTTGSMRKGRPSLYSTVTWGLPVRGPGLCEPAGELMSELYREGHQLCRLVAGEPEHKPLVSCAARIDAHGDVWRLFVDRRQNGASVAIKAVFGACITYFSNGFTCHLRKINLGVRRDFASNDNQPRRHERLAGDTSGAILCKDCIKDCVRNLVGYFIWMAFGYGFRSEEITAGVAQLLNASYGLFGKSSSRQKNA